MQARPPRPTNRRRRSGGRRVLTRVVAVVSAGLFVVAVVGCVPAAALRSERGAPERLRFGVSVLLDDQLSLVRGRRVGLVTDAGARDERGRGVETLFRADPRARSARVVVVAAWRADAAESATAGPYGAGTVADSIRLTGIADAMDSIAAVSQIVVVDLSDDGVRTGAAPWIMLAALRAASQHHVALLVLDRPNPLTGEHSEGPVADASSGASDALYGLPARHGMTLGEMARWFNATGALNTALTVVPMRGWRRSAWPVAPGVTLRRGDGSEKSPEQIAMLGALAPFAATNLHVQAGKGRTHLRVGAPWLDAKAVAGILGDRLMAGLQFRSDRAAFGAGGAMPALVIDVTDRDQASGLRLLGTLVWAVRHVHAGSLSVDSVAFDRTAGSGAMRRAVVGGEDPDGAADRELLGVVDFRRRVRAVLLYR